MKIKYHIPVEQFGFIEAEFEATSEEKGVIHYAEDVAQLIDNAIQEYNALRKPQTGSEGLPHLDWNKIYDGYMATHTLTSEIYEKMNSYQQYAIQEEKKRYKRTNPKELRQ